MGCLRIAEGISSDGAIHSWCNVAIAAALVSVRFLASPYLKCGLVRHSVFPSQHIWFFTMSDNSSSKDNFLTPRSAYWGKPTLPNLTFNANLQEFAQRVSYICNLETGGKMDPEAAYQEIKQLWKQLKSSKKNLLDKPPPEIGPEDLPDDDTLT